MTIEPLCFAVYPRVSARAETRIVAEIATGVSTPTRAEFATLDAAVPFARGFRYLPSERVLRSLIRAGHGHLVTPAEHAALARIASSKTREASSSYAHASARGSSAVCGLIGRVHPRRARS